MTLGDGHVVAPLAEEGNMGSSTALLKTRDLKAGAAPPSEQLGCLPQGRGNPEAVNIRDPCAVTVHQASA